MPRGVAARRRGTRRASRPASPRPNTPKKGGGTVTERGIRWEVVVDVDGKSLPIKEFLHDMIGGTVVGLLTALRGVDAPKRVRLDVRRVSRDA